MKLEGGWKFDEVKWAESAERHKDDAPFDAALAYGPAPMPEGWVSAPTEAPAEAAPEPPAPAEPEPAAEAPAEPVAEEPAAAPAPAEAE